MKPVPCVLAVVSLLALASPAGAGVDLGLRVIPEERFPVELSDEHRFARIDSLESGWNERDDPGRDVLLELSHLYAGSRLMKHRVRGLELNGRLLPHGGDEVLLDRAAMLERTFNPWDQEEVLDALIAQRPGHRAARRAKALYLLEKGLPTLDAELLEAAERAFRELTREADAVHDDWLGLASTLVARDRRQELDEVIPRLEALRPDALSTTLYAAVGLEAHGLLTAAEDRFRAAIARLPLADRARFLDLEGFLEQLRPMEMGDSMLARRAPRELLSWWVRLVECEILFGDPREKLSGWESAPGRVYLLYGRPSYMVYGPPYEHDTVDGLCALHPLEAHRQHLTEAMRSIDLASGYWIWLLRVDDGEIPFVFQKGAAYAAWTPNLRSEDVYLRPLEKLRPLPRSLDHVRRREPVADLHARHVVLAASAARVQAESHVSVRPRPGVDPRGWSVRLRVLAPDGALIDERRVELREDRARGRLLEVAGGALPGAEGFLMGLGAQLPPGEVVFQVELLDAEGRLLEGADQRFRLRSPRSGLAMSDLLLSDCFLEYDPRRSLPPEFVRHARVILPHPEHRAWPGQERLFLYYEIYGAEVDERGRTHLEAIYEVFPREGFDIFDAGLSEAVPSGVQPLLKVRFSDRDTGVSPGGTVVRGTALELGELPPGDYVAVVTVSDRLARQETQRTLHFGK